MSYMASYMSFFVLRGVLRIVPCLLVIEEDLYEVSSKQPIRHEPNCQLVPVLKLSRESVAVDAYASGVYEDNSSKIIPDANKKFDSHIVAEVLFSSEMETEMGIHGSVSNSSWPTSKLYYINKRQNDT
ncbi:hypothetical protein KY289_017930 [Solanum tuberosum]|nr:hypothetical protein KY289_017930 [Solanum tuberosum]